MNADQKLFRTINENVAKVVHARKLHGDDHVDHHLLHQHEVLIDGLLNWHAQAYGRTENFSTMNPLLSLFFMRGTTNKTVMTGSRVQSRIESNPLAEIMLGYNNQVTQIKADAKAKRITKAQAAQQIQQLNNQVSNLAAKHSDFDSSQLLLNPISAPPSQGYVPSEYVDESQGVVQPDGYGQDGAQPDGQVPIQFEADQPVEMPINFLDFGFTYNQAVPDAPAPAPDTTVVRQTSFVDPSSLNVPDVSYGQTDVFNRDPWGFGRYGSVPIGAVESFGQWAALASTVIQAAGQIGATAIASKIGSKSGGQAKQPVVAPVPVQSPNHNLLLYGGIGVGVLALVYVMKNRR